MLEQQEIKDRFDNFYDDIWVFIEKYLPNYYTRDDVLENDILYKLTNDEEVNDDDREHYAYLDTPEKLIKARNESTFALFSEAYKVFTSTIIE